MIKYILYQNDEELNRFNKYNIFKDNIIYFKSKIFNLDNNFNLGNDFNLNFYFKNTTYKKIYVNKLNQNQLNHLLSIREIINDAINNNFQEIMILEYDVYFDKDFKSKYDKYKNLIENNTIIHLGSSQHKWYDIITNEKIIIKGEKNKYYNNSHSLGTFAIILKKDIFKEYIEFINYVLYEYQYFPSDVILSILSRKHKSVVLYPNLIICNLDKSSIVDKNRENDYIKFKWYKHKYTI